MEEKKILFDGVILKKLFCNEDSRGVLTELHRNEWWPDNQEIPVQWNVVASSANVLRGVHVHINHMDYLTCLQGKVTIYLWDLRKKSPTFRSIIDVTLSDAHRSVLVIPPLVAHAIYSKEASLHIYGVSRYWNIDDELGCIYNDPDLNLVLPIAHPILSERDQQAHSLCELLQTIEPYQG